MSERFKIGDRVVFTRPGETWLDSGVVTGFIVTASRSLAERPDGSLVADATSDLLVRLDQTTTEMRVRYSDVVRHTRPSTDRRWRWYTIDMADLERFLLRAANHQCRVTLDGGDTLPADARMVGDLSWDWLTRGVRVRFEHETFDLVGNGCETPYGGCLRVEAKKVEA